MCKLCELAISMGLTDLSLPSADEIDSILSAPSGVDTSADRQLKTQFMNEMNTIVEYKEKIVVIGATNRQEDLDKAIRCFLRPIRSTWMLGRHCLQLMLECNLMCKCIDEVCL